MPSLDGRLNELHATRQILQRDGAVLVSNFLNGPDAECLRTAVNSVYEELASWPLIPDADLETNYRTWSGVSLGALPEFLRQHNAALFDRYDALAEEVCARTRELFGEHWVFYPARSFFRRHVGAKLLIPWHLDADVAKLNQKRCFNVWLPIDPVGRGLPSLEMIRGSHLKLGVSPTKTVRDAVVASLGPSWTPQLDPGDALVFDQFTLHRTQIAGQPNLLRTSCEFRFYHED
jgi:hypothetical protein